MLREINDRMIKYYLILGLLLFYCTSFAQDYCAELVFHKTSISIDKGILTKKIKNELRINNREGEKYSTISIPFSKLVKASQIEAYIKDSKGKTVKKLKKSDIVEKSSISDFSLYEDDFVKEFTLKHNEYPYSIVYSYQIQLNEFLNVAYWMPIISEKVPTIQARLVVTTPKDYKIAYKSRHTDKQAIDTTENTIMYRWNASYSSIVKKEKYSPRLSNFLPTVEIIPIEFNYDIHGSHEDWVSFGNWKYGLLQGLNELPENEKSKIQTLVENIDSDKEKIKVLYHYLQDETRYINVSIETGGLKPYPASYVAQNKYGDCKALTYYFKSILDYVHIPSYYSTVHAGNPILEIDKDFPSQQSNHVILYVPLNDEDIWLDCTSDGAFNYLGTFTQNRDAFVINNNASRFVRTPALKPMENLETRKIKVGYNSNTASVSFVNTYHGNSYEDILYIEKNYNDSEKLRIIRNHFVEDRFQLKDYTINTFNRDSTKIQLLYNATTQDLYRQYGNDVLIRNIPFLLPDFEKPKERKLPVQLDFPMYCIDTIVYEIPKEYSCDQEPISVSINNTYGEYSLNIYKDSDKIIAIKSLLLNAGYYPISEYEDFYNFYIKIAESENKTYITLSK